MEIRKTISAQKNLRYRLVAEGIAVGIFSGLTVTLLRLLIDLLEAFRTTLSDRILLLALFMSICLVLVILSSHFDSAVSGSGIPHVKGELGGQIETLWYRVLFLKIVGTTSAIGAGLSVGRAGPSVQIGAMAGKGVAKAARRSASEERILITAGAGAGLAAAFNAPLAGALFALEEIHRNLSMEVLLAALSASISSDFISSYVFGLKPVFSIVPSEVIPLSLYWLILLFGVLMGASGWLYHLCTKYIQKAYGLLPWKPLRLLIPFIPAFFLVYACPDILGGGNPLVDRLAKEEFLLGTLLLLLFFKFAYSMISFGSGTPGGIFFPLLVLGALQGSIFSHITGTDTYIVNFIMLGMASYFSAIVKSPITGIILISEMTGSLSHLLSLSLVCLAAYVTSDLLKTIPIYDLLLDRILVNEGSVRQENKRKVLMDSYIQAGSIMDGQTLSKLPLPKGVLIISIERMGGEIVPNGDTILKADDSITLLCDESLCLDTEKILLKYCRQMIRL